ncbi:MAG: phosphoribosylformylglycinamidine synthase subunit PurL [Planctomycetota bacterium]|nr:phosphoribosylformylglycinamidine synthase subunit PurL [Planctomycetota bacterium]
MVIHRIEVAPKDGVDDARGRAALAAATAAGLAPLPSSIRCARVYLLDGDLDDGELETVQRDLLGNPVTEEAVSGARSTGTHSVIEVHPLPGVMDPEADAVELAIRSLLGRSVGIRTGVRYDMDGIDDAAARELARRCLANTLIHHVHDGPYHPDTFVQGTDRVVEMPTIPVRDLDDKDLQRLSREGHLFLSLDEMQAIRSYYTDAGRDPREIELETLAQTWSEHCVHKTLKSTIAYEGPLPSGQRPGHVQLDDGRTRIDNLLRSTVAAATHELMADGIDWCLSVFVDNAGIIAFDDDHAVCFKAETHNHPSALEPYGGAATGIGGCIRDVIGTGLAAKPVAATDIFCVAPLETTNLPAGCLQPRRILSQVVAGVRDYGNRMGIPTLNGAVWFDERHVGNPLVFCGCIGLMPRDLVHGDPNPGDRIIAMGGRTGRDGIHGATFSSAELTDSHADEFSHAVQIGNAITEKKMLDAILEARDQKGGPLYTAITDCGAGGFSSAVGEMGEQLGAEVDLEMAPLKYAGLTASEIWISEAQERMVMAVPAENIEALQGICDAHEVEMCDLGIFGTEGRELILRHHGTEVGRLSMALLHEGIPQLTREARWSEPTVEPEGRETNSVESLLNSLLAHPNICSKECIIRQYDHEVQGRSVIRPMVGVHGNGPGDAAVIKPVASSSRGLGIGNGLATGWERDPYLMVLAAIDECVRNLVCVGTDPERIAILDNFCWPGCDDPESLGLLVRAAEGCYDGAKAYRVPFISGKDSLNNQFTTEEGNTIRIPPTLLISGMGLVEDVDQCVTMDAKAANHMLVCIGETTSALGGSHVLKVCPDLAGDRSLPVTDLEIGPARARAVASLIEQGKVFSAHDCSEGGLLVAAVEMAMAGGLGLSLDPNAVAGNHDPITGCFAETPSRYLLEICPDQLDDIRAQLDGHPVTVLGTFTQDARLVTGDVDVSMEELRQTWTNSLII